MIITATPVRISFLGGGTDYPDFFNDHEGATLVTTIDKYSYITIKPLSQFFDYKIKVSYSKMETLNSLEKMNHPAVRECLRFMGIKSNIEITYIGDLPARTGLGSSSSFTVGLLNALHALKGEYASPQQLAEEAVHVEQKMIKERVGIQDQYAAAFGGFNHIQCHQDKVEVNPLCLKPQVQDKLEGRLLLFYTGITRHAHKILKEQVKNTKKNIKYLKKMHSFVNQGINILFNAANLNDFGKLLDEGWQIKKTFSNSITNESIDHYYKKALKSGALGGKLLGAGGGGFIVFYVEEKKQAAVRKALKDLLEVNFKFSHRGSQVIFFNQSGG